MKAEIRKTAVHEERDRDSIHELVIYWRLTDPRTAQREGPSPEHLWQVFHGS